MAKSIQEPLRCQRLFCSKARHRFLQRRSLYPADLEFPLFGCTQGKLPCPFFLLNCIFKLIFHFWMRDIISTFFLSFLSRLFRTRNQHLHCIVDKPCPVKNRGRRDIQGCQPSPLSASSDEPWPWCRAALVPGQAVMVVTVAGGRGQEETTHGPASMVTSDHPCPEPQPLRYQPIAGKVICCRASGGVITTHPPRQPGIPVTFVKVYNQNKIRKSQFFNLPCKNWGLLFNPCLLLLIPFVQRLVMKAWLDAKWWIKWSLSEQGLALYFASVSSYADFLKKQPTAVMRIAVTAVSKTGRESTRLKIICITVKKSRITVLT